MFDRILFPTDGSDREVVVLDTVLEIADAHDATVHILNVADTTQSSVLGILGERVDTLVREGANITQQAAERAGQRGIDTVTEVVRGQPYSSIVEYADTHEIDLVVMPTHGRSGLEQLLLGSTTERVVRTATVPVLTVRPDEESAIQYPFRNVLIPTDGSACANRALALGVDVAKATDASLHLLSVVALESLGVDVGNELETNVLEERANEILGEARETAEVAGVSSVSDSVEYESSIPRAIVTYIGDHGVDLVVIGTHGRTGFDRYVIGGVTERLIRTSPVPVLSVLERG